MNARTGQRVVVVTGGGGGIGAAVAEELGRQGAMVVTVDPLVTLDGADQLPAPEETTADRIVAAGGSARASSASVTDADGIRRLFADLVDEFGRLDGVVNVAGISRPTSFATGAEEDWQAVLSVHLDGYLNVLRAALPIMAAAGHGRILGVTSGSGWRSANAGAYGSAKRAVAALTWQLGRCTPPGVVVNAMSPIAVTRMVTEALARSQRSRGGSAPSASGGLSLGSMPTPEQLGPIGAHLVSEAIGWCRGQVVFVGGPEVAVVEEPRLLEVVRTDGVDALTELLETVTDAWGAVEGRQMTTGAGNPRFGSVFDGSVGGDLPATATRTCAVVTDRPDLGAAMVRALEARGVVHHLVDLGGRPRSFAGAADLLASAVERLGSLDAVVLAPRGAGSAGESVTDWERVLSEHTGIVGRIHDDAGWARAAADHSAAAAERPVRLVTVTDATTAGGRSRAQASAQLARASQGATGDRVAAFAVSVETDRPRDHASVAELAALLACSPESLPLVGAELAVGPGWVGLRGHPRPSGSVVFGGPAVPDWLDGTLRQIVGAPPTSNEETA